MLLFYIRHGDPIYKPDSLTPLGERQAQAISKRLAYGGVDKIFSSTSNRAQETAKPTCEILKKEPVLLDFARETYVWEDFTVSGEEGRDWVNRVPEFKELFCSDEIYALGDKWYEHPKCKEYPKFKSGTLRIERATDEFLSLLGYEHDRGTHTYIITRPNKDRIALFAHQGFGWHFLSALLDIPFPLFSTHFDMSHTGMTVINFENLKSGVTVPQILTLSNDSHLFAERLPTVYDNKIKF